MNKSNNSQQNQSLSFQIEPFFLCNFARIKAKSEGFLGFKPTNRLLRCKSWPNQEISKGNFINFSPKSLALRKNSRKSDKKCDFLSKNSFNMSSFFTKNEENAAPANENAFELSFHGARNSQANDNFNTNPGFLNENNENLLSNIASSIENAPRNDENNPNNNENLENNNIINSFQRDDNEENSVFTELLYRKTLKLFIYKNLKNQFFLHMFFLTIVLKFLYKIEYFFIVFPTYVSDLISLVYYIHKITVCREIFK